MKVIRSEAVQELQRELGMRRRLYPGWVANGKLSQATADKRISLLLAAIELLSVGLDHVEQKSLL
jgi:hypothetical protein